MSLQHQKNQKVVELQAKQENYQEYCAHVEQIVERLKESYESDKAGLLDENRLLVEAAQKAEASATHLRESLEAVTKTYQAMSETNTDMQKKMQRLSEDERFMARENESLRNQMVQYEAQNKSMTND